MFTVGSGHTRFAVATRVAFTAASATSAEYRGGATFAATVADDLGPVANGHVTFSFGRSGIACTAATDASGLASCSVTLPAAETAGDDTVTASFAATDDDLAASATAPFTVTKAPLTVTADDQSRLFGTANPPLTTTLTGFVGRRDARHLGRDRRRVLLDDSDAVQRRGHIPDRLHGRDAERGELRLRLVRPGHAHSHEHGRLSERDPERSAEGRGGTGGLHRPRRDRAGPVTVNAGGSLDVEGGTITGPLRATGAGVIRLCGATVPGPSTSAAAPASSWSAATPPPGLAPETRSGARPT